jgi:hypothetical protein
MPRPSSPLKAWLILSLVVLLLHLVVLQALPLNMSSAAPNNQQLSFATRTLSAEPPALAVPSTKAVRKPVVKPAPLPTVRETAAPQPDVTPEPETHAVAPPASVQEEPAPELAQAPQEVASAPEPLGPELQTPVAERPPREPAPQFRLEGLPSSVKMTYQVQANKFPFTLTGELQWRQDDQHYQASLSFGAFGQTRTQTSRGLINEAGLAPERFSDKYRSEVAAHFNREQGKVTFSANTPDQPLLNGAQDRLSVLVQLAGLLGGMPGQFVSGTTITIQTVGPRDADLWLFTVGNVETLELPGGTMQGLKLTRNARQPYDQQVDIWLAPSLSYMPARIRTQETNGDYIDLKWQASEALKAP